MSAIIAASAMLFACTSEPMERGGQVWIPDAECWEHRFLEYPVPTIDDGWEMYTVDEEGNCWFIAGTPYRPDYWGPAPISVDEACPELPITPSKHCEIVVSLPEESRR